MKSIFFLRLPFLIFLTSLTLGCQSQDDDSNNQPNSPTENSFTYLALGDSYTIGESVAESERYPVQLADCLRQMGTDVMPPDIVAKTGWTTDELSAAIEASEVVGKTYDMVSLLIGVNNQFRGRPVASYKPEFTTLLDRAIGFAGGDTSRVFVVSIPDYAFTPFGNGSPSISQGIDEYNEANWEISAAYGVKYFNITTISREGIDQPELVADDGLHPSGEQYKRWVELIKEEVKLLLEE